MKQELEQELEFLLLNKSFDMLSGIEKKYVLNHLREDEYNCYYLLLKNYSHSVVQEPFVSPDPAIEKELLMAFRSGTKKRSFNLRRLNPMAGEFSSIFKFAAVILLICVAYMMMPRKVNQQDEKEIVQKRIEKEEASSSTGSEQGKKALISAQIKKQKASSSEEISPEFPPEVTKLIRDSQEEPLCLTLEFAPLALDLDDDDSPGLTTGPVATDSELAPGSSW